MEDIKDGKYVGPLTIPEVIEQFEYRISTHVTYIHLIEEDTAWENIAGTIEYGLWAINGYEESIRHMEGKIQIVPKCTILEAVKTIVGAITQLFKRSL